MIIVKVTTAEKALLDGKEFADGEKFAVTEDANGDYVVSIEEIIGMQGNEFDFLARKTLEVVEPIPYTPPGIT